MPALLRKALAEFIGTGVFLTAIVGVNAVMSPTVLATAVLATALGLMVLLTSTTSGGHLNPAVTFFFAARREISWSDAAAYIVAQILGGLTGSWLGGALHGFNYFTPNNKGLGTGEFLSEVVATAGLVWLIGNLAARERGNIIPLVVGLWVFSAANFTSSGASANPAVTIGRMFTPIAGVGVSEGLYWIVAEVLGVLIAIVALNFVTPLPGKKKKSKK
jgi:glycerol uptake facilitator-like aquaporin